MSNQDYPDRNHDRKDDQAIQQDAEAESLRLWGRQLEGDSEYGDLRDQSLQASSPETPPQNTVGQNSDSHWDADRDYDNQNGEIDWGDDDNLRLWGSKSEAESEYGDLRDMVFEAGTTSRPGSADKVVNEERGWQGEDSRNEAYDDEQASPRELSQRRNIP
jgi:hypothetical protein